MAWRLGRVMGPWALAAPPAPPVAVRRVGGYSGTMKTCPQPAASLPPPSVGRVPLALFLLGALRLAACSTPVFQYALENWPPDVYDVVVAVNGLSEATVRTVADSVLRPDVGGRANAGLRVREDPAVAAGSGHIEVRFPHQPPAAPALWTRPWSSESLRQIADSPVRSRLADELLHHASAVFLFLPAGDAAADTAARARLETTLQELARTLVLPTPDDDAAPGDTAAAPRPLRFAILDIPPDDPAEAFLRHLLLATEPDLAGLKQPMAFPVFGRGRVLYAIVGAGINRDVLAETCAFLAGACSCLVKSQNPGVDLLLRADWDQVTGLGSEGGATELPPLTLLELPPLDVPSAASAAPLPPAASASPPAVPPAMVPPPPALLSRRLLQVAALAVVIAAVGSLVLWRSRSR